LTEFCGCSPAYFVPAVPSGLNADPGAEIEWPGWFGVSSQLAFGCPVVERAVRVDWAVAMVGFVAVVVCVVVPARVVIPLDCIVLPARIVLAECIVSARIVPAVLCSRAPPAAKAAAETSDSVHVATNVVMDFSFCVLIAISLQICMCIFLLF
jgi:hypothetical protein